jgi:hypothetical protein
MKMGSDKQKVPFSTRLVGRDVYSRSIFHVEVEFFFATLDFFDSLVRCLIIKLIILGYGVICLKKRQKPK